MAADEATEFRVLGPLAVTRDGEPIALPGGKAAAALAALVLEAPRSVTSARLAEIRWGEGPPTSARNALQVHLSAARRALRAGGVRQGIVQRGDGYALEADAGQVDLHRFAELRRTALRQAVAGDLEPAATTLRDALALWHGDALAGIRNERLAIDAERMEEMRLAAHEELYDAELSCGRSRESIDELTRLVAEHPLRERLRGLLMLALYRSGRQADALAAYRDLRRRLSEELGIVPSPEVQELERRILRHDQALRLATPLVLREPGDAPRRRSLTAVACELRSRGISDPEAWERVAAPLVAVVQAELERHGAVVDVVLGGTVLAVFGTQGARERHAARAGRAALACRELLAAADPGGVELRIGLESGVAVTDAAADTHELGLGAAPATAVRLAHTARPGEIVVGARARELAGESFALEGGSDARLAAVVAWTDQPSWRTSRFVGRRKELAALERAFAASVGASAPRLLTVVGAPGIGKTRLADELAGRIDARRARGACPEDGAQRTFWPLREAVDDVGLLDQAAIAATLAGRPDGERLARVVAETLGLTGPELGGEERAVAVSAFFEEIAREDPLLLILDDLQWAEPSLLALVEELLERCAAPLLVLCLSRVDPRELRAGWPGEALPLGPLTGRECAHVTARLLGSDPPADAIERIVTASEGSPLFAEELSVLVREDTRDDGEPLLPETIDALLTERLERLGPLEREAVERAAVEGQTFHLGGVAELCRDEVDRVRETLHELVRRDVLRPTRPQLPGHEAFRFRHVLIRDAAYSALPRQLRAELNERWVDWLDGALDGELAGWESVAGTHLEASWRARRELAPDEDTSELARRAGELLAAAALRAEASEDLEAAASLAARALALLPVGHPLRVELVWRAVLLLVAMGRIEQALALCAGRDASSDADAPLVELAQLLVLTFAGAESPSALAAAMRRAERAVRRTGSLHLEATLEASIGWRHYQRGQIDRFLDRFRRAHGLAVRGNDRRQQAVCAAWIAVGLVRGGTPAREAGARCESLIADPEVPRTLETQVLLALAELHAMQGKRKLARSLLDRSTEIIEDLRLDWVAAKLCRHTATVELLLGDRDGAHARLTAGRDGFVAIGAPSHAATLVARLALLAADEGRADDALELAAECRSIALHDDELAHVEARAAAASAHALRGEHERARRQAAAAVRRASRTDEPVLRATALSALADAALAAGRTDDAEAALEAALAEYESKGHRVLARATGRRLARLRGTSPARAGGRALTASR